MTQAVRDATSLPHTVPAEGGAEIAAAISATDCRGALVAARQALSRRKLPPAAIDDLLTLLEDYEVTKQNGVMGKREDKARGMGK